MPIREDEKRQVSIGLGPFRGCRREPSNGVAIKELLLVVASFSRGRPFSSAAR
jgi:hypothetical protein